MLVTEGATCQRQRRMLRAVLTPRKVAAQADLIVSAAAQALDAALLTHSNHAAQRVELDALECGE